MTCTKMYGAQKAKGLLSKLKYQNFRYRSQNEMYCSKMIKNYELKEAKSKVSKICNHFLRGGHICSFL